MTAMILLKILLVILICGVLTFLYNTMPVPNPFTQNKTYIFALWTLGLGFAACLILALLALSAVTPETNKRSDA